MLGECLGVTAEESTVVGLLVGLECAIAVGLLLRRTETVGLWMYVGISLIVVLGSAWSRVHGTLLLLPGAAAIAAGPGDILAILLGIACQGLLLGSVWGRTRVSP
jgi:hypothetical protein